MSSQVRSKLQLHPPPSQLRALFLRVHSKMPWQKAKIKTKAIEMVAVAAQRSQANQMRILSQPQKRPAARGKATQQRMRRRSQRESERQGHQAKKQSKMNQPNQHPQKQHAGRLPRMKVRNQPLSEHRARGLPRRMRKPHLPGAKSKRRETGSQFRSSNTPQLCHIGPDQQPD